MGNMIELTHEEINLVLASLNLTIVTMCDCDKPIDKIDEVINLRQNITEQAA